MKKPLRKLNGRLQRVSVFVEAIFNHAYDLRDESGSCLADNIVHLTEEAARELKTARKALKKLGSQVPSPPPATPG